HGHLRIHDGRHVDSCPFGIRFRHGSGVAHGRIGARWVGTIIELIPWLLAMLLLIGLSGFFSGSEAALFCLRWSDRRALTNGTPSQRQAERLLHDPDRLLSSVLFLNLCLNMTYFAIVSAAGARLADSGAGGSAGVLAFTIGAILLIIILGELLPKSLAVL